MSSLPHADGLLKEGVSLINIGPEEEEVYIADPAEEPARKEPSPEPVPAEPLVPEKVGV